MLLKYSDKIVIFKHKTAGKLRKRLQKRLLSFFMLI